MEGSTWLPRNLSEPAVLGLVYKGTARSVWVWVLMGIVCLMCFLCRGVCVCEDRVTEGRAVYGGSTDSIISAGVLGRQRRCTSHASPRHTLIYFAPPAWVRSRQKETRQTSIRLAILPSILRGAGGCRNAGSSEPGLWSGSRWNALQPIGKAAFVRMISRGLMTFPAAHQRASACER